MVGLEGHKLNYAVRFGFKTSKNAFAYEALLPIFRLSEEMQVKRLEVNSYSRLVVSEINGNFIARDKSMAAYVKKVIDLLSSFENF